MSALAPGKPQVLIVTPYFREPRATLERCIASVAAQSVPTTHMLVADGHPQPWIASTGVRQIVLDCSHGNFGNTPRAIGLMAGIGEGYPAIGLLDADNWIDPDHVATCLAAADGVADADYVVAQRRFRRIDGSIMPLAEEPDDQHVDTSCFLLLPGSFGTVPVWGTMPDELAPICDRVFYAALKSRRLVAAQTSRATVNFAVTVDEFYRYLGEQPPPGSKPGVDVRALATWLAQLTPRDHTLVERRSGTSLSAKLADPCVTGQPPPG